MSIRQKSEGVRTRRCRTISRIEERDRETLTMQNVLVIPIIIGALGTIGKGFRAWINQFSFYIYINIIILFILFNSLSILVISYSQVFSSILVSSDRVILFVCCFVYILREVEVLIYIYIYIYMVITKKSPLSILNHLRIINLTCLKQRFDDCLFQVSFYLYNFF